MSGGECHGGGVVSIILGGGMGLRRAFDKSLNLVGSAIDTTTGSPLVCDRGFLGES